MQPIIEKRDLYLAMAKGLISIKPEPRKIARKYIKNSKPKPKPYRFLPGVLAKVHRMNPIKLAVAKEFGVSTIGLEGKSRHEPLVTARQLCYLFGRYKGLSFPVIAASFNKFDHSTAIHGVRLVAGKLAADAELRLRFEAVGKRLEGVK